MLFRKYEDESGAALPQKWADNASLSFQEYFSQAQGDFHVYGRLHQDELLIITSLVPKAEDQSPVSLFLSKDLSESESSNPKKFAQIKDTMTDIAGIIFKDLLEDLENTPYSAEWISYKYKKKEFFYKISRENIELFLKAEELLNS